MVGLTQADIADALKDGRIQASIVGGSGVPVQWIVDLSQVRDIKIISFPDDAISKLTSKYPFFLKGEIPSNSYMGVNYTFTTLTHPTSSLSINPSRGSCIQHYKSCNGTQRRTSDSEGTL
ncbi:MAG: TAXI family TRAP transporter solute-binding subunit [Candidatus Methanomethylicaceae archaeon]